MRRFPVNYDTCLNFITLLIKAILFILFILSGRGISPQTSKYYYIQSNIGRRLNNVCVLYVYMCLKGQSHVSKIQKKKEKHVWSAKVLEKLLDKGRGKWYDSTGKNPLYKDRAIQYEGSAEAVEWSDLPDDAELQDQSSKAGMLFSLFFFFF